MALKMLTRRLGIYLTPPSWRGNDTRSIFFKGNKVGLNLQFSFSWTGCLIKAKEHSLLYYFSVAGCERKNEIIVFPRAFPWSEKQIDFSRIWTQITHFISYNDNLHAMDASWNP